MEHGTLCIDVQARNMQTGSAACWLVFTRVHFRLYAVGLELLVNDLRKRRMAIAIAALAGSVLLALNSEAIQSDDDNLDTGTDE